MPSLNWESYMPRASGLNRRRGRPRKTGGFKLGKKRRPVGNRKIKNLKKSQMGRIGLSAALALKTLKKHEPVITDSQAWDTIAATANAIDRAMIVHPFALDKSASTSETQRECDNIYYFNCRGMFEVKPLMANLENIHLRLVMGYSKGNPDLSSGLTPWQGATGLKLSNLLPTIHDKLDPDHYRVIKDRVYDYSPKQIYQTTAITSASHGVTGLENFGHKANWVPFKVRYNFKFNRKVLFDGAAGTDAIGDIPFVALLIYTNHDTEHAYTGATGAYPSPHCRVEEKAYFKDC